MINLIIIAFDAIFIFLLYQLIRCRLKYKMYINRINRIKKYHSDGSDDYIDFLYNHDYLFSFY